jgi:CRISPR-associated endonuclease/helicase Cas3
MGSTQVKAHRWLATALGVEAPFPWQLALLRHFLAGDIPTALDIPTGLGKTAVMAIWMAAKAAGAPLPRRLVYVVDRRAVVDQATKVAENLRAQIEQDQELKKSLKLRGSLPISTLRGKFADNREWLADPSSPAIILGTVDMVGSRLLFEGYGVSRKMRPFHAGLLGNDTLLIIDESHLVPPFAKLIESIANDRSLSGSELVPSTGLRGLPLSATGPLRSEALTLTSDDLAHPEVARRLKAEKRLVVRNDVERQDLPTRLAEEALALVGSAAQRCIVFCNSRDDAQRVESTIRSKRGASCETQLFVGGRRIYERQEAADWLEARGFLAGSDIQVTRPTFLIATSAGEVGVDLDAHHMVSDLVSWERMVQRLGRVNRRGNSDARVVVVPIAPDAKDQKALSKYRTFIPEEAVEDGESDNDDDRDDGTEKLKPEERALAEQYLRLQATRTLINELPSADGTFDASPGSLTTLRSRSVKDATLRALIASATTPEPLRPALTRPLVEAWSMTSLEEHTGRPEVTPWLRGWIQAEEPQTTLVWRTMLPLTSRGTLLQEEDQAIYFETAAPHMQELLETESRRAFAWLLARVQGCFKATWAVEQPSTQSPIDIAPEEGSDTEIFGSPTEADSLTRGEAAESEAEQSDGDDATRGERAPLLRRNSIVALICRNDIVTSVRLRQYSQETLNDLKSKIEGATVFVDVRLGGLLHGLLDHEHAEATDVTTLQDEGQPVVPIRLRRARDLVPSSWREEARLVLEANDGEASAWLVIESDPLSVAQSEEGRSSAPVRAQLLQQHEEWAEEAATHLARDLQLSEKHAEMLALAARLHDEGKRAERWQRAFLAPPGDIYGKTCGRPNLQVLDGYRHELGSLPRIESDERFLALDPALRDLCLHLVAAHHGHARPSISTRGAEEPPSLLEQRAQSIAQRFVRMEKRWGPWGLAWWESLLRAADQQASRRNDQEGIRG